ncbi:DUF4381 domain-containing protein [soil metagenome]
MSDPADLSNLRDIVVPPAVSFWPPAPGWWLVGAACLVATGVAIAAVVRHRRRNAYRREALRELESADVRDISAILKRAALAAFPREQVASLSGPAWLAFLDRTGGTRFEGTALASLPYGGSADRDAVLAKARHWITHHTPSPVFGGGVGVLRRRRGRATEIVRHAPSVTEDRATSPASGGGR